MINHHPSERDQEEALNENRAEELLHLMGGAPPSFGSAREAEVRKAISHLGAPEWFRAVPSGPPSTPWLARTQHSSQCVRIRFSHGIRSLLRHRIPTFYALAGVTALIWVALCVRPQHPQVLPSVGPQSLRETYRAIPNHALNPTDPPILADEFRASQPELRRLTASNGFHFLPGTKGANYEVACQFTLDPPVATTESAVPPSGFALILHGDEAAAPEWSDGLGIQVDLHHQRIYAKDFVALPERNEATVRVLKRSDSVDALCGVHDIRVQATGIGPDRGLYRVWFDGVAIGDVHHFDRRDGLVGIRLWGSPRLKIASLQVLPLPIAASATAQPMVQVIAAGASRFPGLDDAAGPVVEEGINSADLTATTDVKTILQVLERGAHPRAFRSRVFLDDDLRPDTFLHALGDLPLDGGPDDILVVYFGGHGGLMAGNNETWLLTPHARSRSLATLKSGAIPIRAACNALAAHKHRVKVLMLDCCMTGLPASLDVVGSLFNHAGSDAKAFEPQALLNSLASNNERLVIMAASSDKALETPTGGVFSLALADGLLGAADVNGNHEVTLGELVRFLNSAVPKLSAARQIPLISAGWESHADVVLTFVKR